MTSYESCTGRLHRSWCGAGCNVERDPATGYIVMRVDTESKTPCSPPPKLMKPNQFVLLDDVRIDRLGPTQERTPLDYRERCNHDLVLDLHGAQGKASYTGHFRICADLQENILRSRSRFRLVLEEVES